MQREDASQAADVNAQPCYTGHERRESQRLRTPFSVTVRAGTPPELQFEEDAVLDNFSHRGLYVRLTHRVQHGAQLLVLLRSEVPPDAMAVVAWIELDGIVLRTEAQPDGNFGTAIRLTHHRYIYTTAPTNYACLAC